VRSLVVKLTAGADAPERCLQGLTVAATAHAAGADTSLWLTGESVLLATKGHDIEIPHSPKASELLASLPQVQVCTQCAARRGITQQDLKPGITIAGAASFVEQALAPDTQALVY
jgi:predicted peroxiredoxin